MHLSDEELELHARHLALPEVGERGQLILSSFTVNVSDDFPSGLSGRLTDGLRRAGLKVVSGPGKLMLLPRPEAGIRCESGVMQVGVPPELTATLGLWWVGLMVTEVVSVALSWRTMPYQVDIRGMTHRVVAMSTQPDNCRTDNANGRSKLDSI